MRKHKEQMRKLTINEDKARMDTGAGPLAWVKIYVDEAIRHKVTIETKERET